MSSAKPLLIAIVGAESTGKTQLSLALREALIESTGLRCAVVPEYLRTWCETEGRTPRPHEQATIAEHQITLIDGAAATHDLVLCDTTPLMTAVYSELLFQDRSLHALGQAFHLRCDLTLLTALDIPWVADGLQRDGPHVRGPVDAAVRKALLDASLGWSVVAGTGALRVEAALNAITPLLLKRQAPRAGLLTRLNERQASFPEQRWLCDCDVPECEHASLNPTPAA
nr:ATP-binding protein [uncultured Roseateles sp.]